MKDRSSRIYRAVALGTGDREEIAFVEAHPLNKGGVLKECRKARELAIKLELDGVRKHYEMIDDTRNGWASRLLKAAEGDQVAVGKLLAKQTTNNRMRQLWEVLHVITFALTDLQTKDWAAKKGLT